MCGQLTAHQWNGFCHSCVSSQLHVSERFCHWCVNNKLHISETGFVINVWTANCTSVRQVLSLMCEQQTAHQWDWFCVRVCSVWACDVYICQKGTVLIWVFIFLHKKTISLCVWCCTFSALCSQMQEVQNINQSIRLCYCQVTNAKGMYHGDKHTHSLTPAIKQTKQKIQWKKVATTVKTLE